MANIIDIKLPKAIASALRIPQNDPQRQQLRVLKKLLKKARFTELGQEYRFDEILFSRNPAKQFQKLVPVHDYNKIYNRWWKKTLQGVPDVAWPGKIKYYALSSGTSEAASKYIPVTKEMLRSNTINYVRQLLTYAALYRDRTGALPIRCVLFFINEPPRQDRRLLAIDVTPPIVEVICAEAHRLGMTVTGHIPNGMTIEQAAAAGMDHIAHLGIRGEAGSDDVNKTIAFLRDHKTVIDPTQSWNELLGHAVGTPIAAFQPGVLKIPPPLNRVFSNAGAAGIDAATARTRLERGLRIVKALHDAGVPVVAGTDEGIPGYSVHREIELYVEAGLTPMEALQAATIVSARAMKMDADLGSIERGKRADMVVLNANPLDAIRNIRSVRWTISDGRVYDAPTLWQSVRFQP